MHLPRLPASTTPVVSTSIALPTPTPPPYIPQELVKRDQKCGNMGGNYPNAEEPICSGTFSICTFKDEAQGCCDNSGNCNFYSECVEAYAPQTCSEAGCLQCSFPAIYCSKYEFSGQGSDTYNAFACGHLDMAGQVLYGSVATETAMPNSMEGHGSSMNSSMTSSRTMTNSPSPSTNVNMDNASKPHRNNGAIIGGSLAGLAVLAGVAYLAWRAYKHKQYRYQELHRPPVLSQ